MLLAESGGRARRSRWTAEEHDDADGVTRGRCSGAGWAGMLLAYRFGSGSMCAQSHVGVGAVRAAGASATY